MIKHASINLIETPKNDYVEAWDIHLKSNHTLIGFCGFRLQTFQDQTLLVLECKLSRDVFKEVTDFCSHYAHDYLGQNEFSLLVDEPCDDLIKIGYKQSGGFKGKWRYDYHLISLSLYEHVPSHDLIAWDYDIYLINLKGIEIGRLVYRYGSDEALKYCGHIGYEIEASYRGHHYSRTALKLLIDKLQSTQDHLILSCDKDNIASKKIIQSFHPVSYKQVVVEDGEFETLDIYEVKL